MKATSDFNGRTHAPVTLGTVEGTATHKILNFISGECSRNEISLLTGVRSQALSAPLSLLCNAGLLLKRSGSHEKRMYYRLPGVEQEDQEAKPFMCTRCLSTVTPKGKGKLTCIMCEDDDSVSSHGDNGDRWMGRGWDEKLSMEYLTKPIAMRRDA